MFRSIIHNRFTKTIKTELLCFFGKKARFISLEAYAHNHPGRIRFINRSIEQGIYSKPRIELNDKTVMCEVGPLEAFVALIKDACCFAYSDLIVLDDNNYYCEIKQDAIIGRSSNCSDGYVLLVDEKSYYEVVVPEEEKKLDSGFFLSGLFSWNYYHFTYQVLPKLQMDDAIDSSIPLLVDKKAKEIPSFAVLLAICNRKSRPVEVMEEKVKYRVGQLYYVSSPSYLEPNHKLKTPYPSFGCRFRPSALRFLRDMMIPVAQQDRYPKRIFVGRKYVNSGRRQFNEDECIACAKSFGFEVVFPEMMTLEQQIGIFNNAEMIIGGSGAAFANLIYCKVGVKVIVLAKYRPAMGLWQTIVEFIGGDLLYLCEADRTWDDPNRVHDPFSIDVDRLKILLNAVQ